MTLNITTQQGLCTAELISQGIEISGVDQALDLIGNSSYQGAEKIVIRDIHLAPEFFDLKTGLAGEILQKFSTYSMKLDIVGDFSTYTSKSLQDFMRESNQGGKIRFIHSAKE